MKRISNFYQFYTGKIPIFLVDPRGPLDYFIWSDSLFGISINQPSMRIRLDENSVLMFDYGFPIGVKYNPAYISWWGLVNLREYLQTNKNIYLTNFINQAKWLLSNRKERRDNIPVWNYDFDWQEGNTSLRAPWISAMSQGLVISCLIRAYRLIGDKNYFDVAYKASEIFEINIEKGGVRTIENNKIFYEEYPAHPFVRILDGFIFALLGLYDLYEETGDNRIKILFDEGLDGLISNIKNWDYKNIWSRYGNHNILSPPEYNKLNAVLMQVLYKITGNRLFKIYWKAWDMEEKNLFKKTKTLIFILFKKL